MTAEPLVETLLVGGVAGLFLYAASFKILDLSPLRRTLSDLGLSPALIRVAAPTVLGTELAIGLAVAGFAPTLVASLLVAIAAAGIATAGVVGLRRETPIPCACFSPRSSAALGLRQLVVAALLLGAAASLVALDPSADVELSLVRISAVSLATTVMHLLAMSRDVVAIVGYRRAAAGVYPS